MRKIGLVVLLIVLVGFASGCISSGDSATETAPPATQTPQTTQMGDKEYVIVNGTKIYLGEVYFYMYGMRTCPHCQKMKEEIPKEYGADHLVYYELLDNEENTKLFSEQYKYTGIGGVPAIAITYNGTLYAIIEGEYNVSATPRIIKAAMDNDGMVLFVGGQAYIIKDKSVIDKLYAIYVEHRMPEGG
ncbi:glutaredoxin [Thermococcus sp. M36]|uniref:glutaredoxin domain-containing protein n=1 Tax=Thermococcus sp. M36 TaxID=1638261 RepID=UPI00143886D0|nr:glutaredoxin domain-containing protein [Thermococcus sp. M36]NJE06236.1 glutaredoxin [Thermococcus sp. M36]